MKRLIALLLGIVLMVSQGICVFAEENEDFSKLEIVETNQKFCKYRSRWNCPYFIIHRRYFNIYI